MLSKAISDEINHQVNEELFAWYNYLQMAAYAESIYFPGFATYLRDQAAEEQMHAMKLYDFLVEWGAKVELRAINKPDANYTSLLDVFERALKAELHVNDRVNALYDRAFKEKAFAAHLQFQWFVNEQIDEVKTTTAIVAQLRSAKDDAAALLFLDREIGSRAGGNGKSKA